MLDRRGNRGAPNYSDEKGADEQLKQKQHPIIGLVSHVCVLLRFSRSVGPEQPRMPQPTNRPAHGRRKTHMSARSFNVR
jgi:hypothetical protein